MEDHREAKYLRRTLALWQEELATRAIESLLAYRRPHRPVANLKRQLMASVAEAPLMRGP